MEVFYKWFFLQEGRTPEGYFSFEHLFSVGLTLLIFFGLAVLLAILFKRDNKKQDLVITIAGIAIVVIYLAELIELFTRCKTPKEVGQTLLSNLPLFLCDMSIIVTPIAGLSKGKIKGICCDFLAIWGLIMGVFGTVLAGNIYSSYCVISWPTIVSLLNHSISGFVSLFIVLTRKSTMSKENMPYVFGILTVIMLVALIIVHTVPNSANYMFFKGGDGTPYDILYINLFNKNIILYDISVFVCQHAFMGLYYLCYYLIVEAYRRHNLKKQF